MIASIAARPAAGDMISAILGVEFGGTVGLLTRVYSAAA